MSSEQLSVLLKRMEKERERRRSTNLIASLYPAEGPFSRDKYGKFLQFFKAGADYRERAIVAANRVGKSYGVGGYETTLHLTGDYPDWWQGRRFDHPVSAWAAGDTSETTRDIIQKILTGVGGEREGGYLGTGLIPLSAFRGEPSRRSGVAGAFDTISVQHVSGGVSTLGLKSYDQGRTKFQGTSKHLIWLDEEPPIDVYSECLTRTLDCDGIVLCTFTPLLGISEVVMKFLPDLDPTNA
jgi:phage terminase large subunit-like protein